MSASFFLHSSFLQAISAVMPWPVLVQKVPQASKHLCPAKLQTRCDVCCGCRFIYPFIPTGSGVPRTVDPQKSVQPRLCMAVCQSEQPIPDSTFFSRVIESVRMACVICVSRWEASHCFACVTASTPTVRLEVVTASITVFVYSPFHPA